MPDPVAVSAPSLDRSRRSADETRCLLLQAGTTLAIRALGADEASRGGPLAHIRLRDVCREASATSGAPVTTGAAYHVWPQQEAFQVDLMFHLLDQGAYASIDDVLRLASELFAAKLPLTVLTARLSDESLRLESESPVARATVALKTLAGVPAIHMALRAAHVAYLDTARKLYEQLLTYGGLRMREPYTLEQLMTAMGALLEGLMVARSFLPEHFEVPPGADSVVASACLGMFVTFCEADPEGTGHGH